MLQQSYGMSTYSIAPNINIFNYNLSYAFAHSSAFRIYNLDKIPVSFLKEENSVKKVPNSSTKLQKKFVLSHKIGFPFLYLHNKIVFT